jgi:hypothetical protein
MRVEPKTGAFAFESRDGYPWIIDPTTLVPARFTGQLDAIPATDSGPFGPSLVHERAILGDDEYSLEGGTRTTLARHATSTPADRVLLHPEHTYLRGEVLRSLDDPPRVLVLEEVLDHGRLLWCLSADGATQWKTELPADLLAQKRYRDTIVLVTKTMLISVRVEDGTTVWTSPP